LLIKLILNRYDALSIIVEIKEEYGKTSCFA